jgi:hypothetical protein
LQEDRPVLPPLWPLSRANREVSVAWKRTLNDCREVLGEAQ